MGLLITALTMVGWVALLMAVIFGGLYLLEKLSPESESDKCTDYNYEHSQSRRMSNMIEKQGQEAINIQKKILQSQKNTEDFSKRQYDIAYSDWGVGGYGQKRNK